MAKISPDEYSEKWARRLKNATEDIRTGIERVSEAPGKRAAAKRQKWATRMSEASTHDKWAKNISSVPLDEWKRRATEVGVNRISAGVDASADKMARFGQALLSYQDQNRAKIDAMPDLTLADSKARLDAWFDIMSKFRYNK